MTLAFQIVIAFIADLLFGDPKSYPHPVKLIASLASKLENFARHAIKNLKLAGFFTTIIVVSASFLSVWLIIFALEKVHSDLSLAVSIFFIYTTLSARSLYDESLPVLNHLDKKDLSNARETLSKIVGRDTKNLETNGIVRATVETIAESTVDGIIAPLVFSILGGAPLAIAYKAINTLDSLFGYKNEKYLHFGWFPAKLDDFANWVPARLALPLIALGAMFCGLSGKGSLLIGVRDGINHPSPNSGYPEAAFAGALGIRLGGTSYYSGNINEKPFIGDNSLEPQLYNIHQSQKLMFATSILAVVTLIFIEIIPYL